MAANLEHVPIFRPVGGFSFDNCKRNEFLTRSANMHLPKAHKTGTTIVGCVYKDGVCLGADTRATEDTTVCDKNCEKIHFIAPNIYCCGAGTAADTEQTTALISSQLLLQRYATGRQSLVVTAMTKLKRMLFRYQGHISAALILGGVDYTGPHLYTVYPHGSTDKLPYVTMGSGSLAAMSVFEAKWKPDMTRDEAVQLVRDAICAGIFNDLGSGGNVDICVLTSKGKEYLRNYEMPNPRKFERRPIEFPLGTTPVLRRSIQEFVTVTPVATTMEVV
eukprot:gnl/Spiro4/6231_TR3206_c0_g1_i1.p2 gnl/Spiro4/6231_TR3206_c0_g1~~gnl/Spiro4/6231_TR3206_c0_g1_i1.p2  ORF type:complete len:291 (+),score=100.52 gnl/Spiro4/6231_TR3206_c0_g1_i1:46-873(+)